MKKTLQIGLGLALGIAFLAYALVGETGPIGWLNAGQQWVFGAYSRKVSMFVLLCIGVALAPVWVWAWAFFESDPLQQDRSSPGAKPFPWALGCVLGFVGGMALVWGATYGYLWWDLRQRSADSIAVYEPLDLTVATRAPGAGHEHLALRGRALGDHVVSRTSGDSKESSQRLVPIVGRDWREGDPVHFVARLDPHGSQALRDALRSSPELLVRTDGSVPTPALQVFEKMKSPIADDAVAVLLVAMQDGRPAPVPQEFDWTEARVWAVVGSFCVTLGTFFMLIVPWSQRRQGRQAVKRQQAAARPAAR